VSIFLASLLKSPSFTKLFVNSSVVILCAWIILHANGQRVLTDVLCVCVCVFVCVAEVPLPSVGLNKDNTDTG